MALIEKDEEILNVKWFNSSAFKLLVGIVVILFLTFFVVEKWISKSQTKDFIDHATKDASLVSKYIKNRIVKEMLAGEKLKNIRPLIDGLVLNGKIDKIMLLNLEGVIRHSSNHELIDKKIILSNQEGCLICHSDLTKVPNNATVVTRDHTGKKVIRTKIPIVNQIGCHACHSSEKKYRAILIIDSKFTELEGSLNSIKNKLFTGLKFASFIILITLVILLNTLYSSPLKRLLEGIKEVIKGNLKYRIVDRGKDEMASVSRAFNHMTENINIHINHINQKNLELNSLYSIIEKLSRTMNIDELRDIVLSIFFEMFEVSEVNMLMYTFIKDEVEMVSKKRGFGEDKYLGLLDQSLRDKLKEISEDNFNEFIHGTLKEPVISKDLSNILVPLFIPEEPTLGFVLVKTSKDYKFTENEQRTIVAISNHISVAVTNAKLYSISITDELTKVYAKRYFLIRINEEIQRFFRYGEFFSLMIIDIDKFKDINDTYGHLAGDLILKRFANLIKRQTRVMDICARYGGDEFVILSPNGNKDYSFKIADKIRSEMEKEDIYLEDGRKINITLSIGISVCPDHGDSLEVLFANADSALYKSKEAGRNKVTVFDT